MDVPVASTSPLTDKNADGQITKKEALDLNADGRVSHQEFALLDSDRNGGVSKRERLDLNQDGRISPREQQHLDTNGDGAVSRHEILEAPVRDVNHDGKLTFTEALGGHHQLHRSPPPPRTTWAYGYADTFEEAFDEAVLWIVFFVSLYQAVVWVVRRVRGKRGKAYRPVARMQSTDGLMRVDEESLSQRRPGESAVGGGDELEQMSTLELMKMQAASVDIEEVCTSVEEDKPTLGHVPMPSEAEAQAEGWVAAHCIERPAAAAAPGPPPGVLPADDESTGVIAKTDDTYRL